MSHKATAPASRIVALASLDMSLSLVAETIAPNKAHVEHMRLFGVLAPIVVQPGTCVVVRGHYDVILARRAGLTSIAIVDASADMVADRPHEATLALDHISTQPTSGAKARVLAMARDAGATPQGLSERTSYTVDHVHNVLRAWDGACPEVRAAWVSGAIPQRDVVNVLCVLSHDEQRTHDLYLATTPEHAARVARERAIAKAAKRLAKLQEAATATVTAVAPESETRLSRKSPPDAVTLASAYERARLDLASAAGPAKDRLRGIVDALAFAIGETAEIPATLPDALPTAETVEAPIVTAKRAAREAGKARKVS